MEILPPKYQKYRMFPQLQQNDENEQMQKALEFSGELLILQMDRYKCSRCGDISTWDVAHFPIPVLITCSDCVYLKFNSGGGGECCQECSPENKVKFKYKGGNVTND